MADWIEEYYDHMFLGEFFAQPIRQRIREESYLRQIIVANPLKQEEDEPHAAPPEVRKRPRHG